MAIIESVEDTMDGVKKVVGKNGLLFLGVGFVGLFLISYMMQSKTETEEVAVVTGIASYPDVVTNADVIIDTLENSIAYSQYVLGDSIEQSRVENADLFGGLSEQITTENNATNNYIKEGFAKQEEMAEKIGGSIAELSEDMNAHFKELNDTVLTETGAIRNDIRVSKHEVMDGINASYLASALQTEQAEMNIRNEIAVKGK